jgi:hypothetical protein
MIARPSITGFLTTILLVFTFILPASADMFDFDSSISVDGNDLDWNFQQCYVTVDHTGSVPARIDIKRFSWESNDDYTWFVVNFNGYGRGLPGYEYILNIDRDFNDTADTIIGAMQKTQGTVSSADESGEITSTDPVTRVSGIRTAVGTVVEYRVPRQLLGDQCQVFFAVWNSESNEMIESTVWQAITPGVPFTRKGPDLSVALKHLSGRQHGLKSGFTIDGDIDDWAGIQYKKLADNTAFYHQDDEYFYLLLGRGNYRQDKDLVYYVNVDTNSNLKRNFLVAARSGQTGYYQKRGVNTSLDEIPGMACAVDRFVEYRIPLEFFTQKDFLLSNGIYHKALDRYYYYTSWKEFSLTRMKANRETVTRITEQEEQYDSGVKELLTVITDPALKNRLQQFLGKGVENLLNLLGVGPGKIADHSKKYLGVPYVYGRADINGTDCSGMTYATFNDFNIDLPRGANSQSRNGKIIARKEKLRKGDLVFFTNTYKTSSLITHVGIYQGNNQFINANSYYGKVVIDDINDSYWNDKFIFGTRGQ